MPALEIYRKATVLRTNPAHVKRFGAFAFGGLFKTASDGQIAAYFSTKMEEEGYKQDDYSIEIISVVLHPETGEAINISEI